MPAFACARIAKLWHSRRMCRSTIADVLIVEEVEEIAHGNCFVEQMDGLEKNRTPFAGHKWLKVHQITIISIIVFLILFHILLSSDLLILSYYIIFYIASFLYDLLSHHLTIFLHVLLTLSSLTIFLNYLRLHYLLISIYHYLIFYHNVFS